MKKIKKVKVIKKNVDVKIIDEGSRVKAEEKKSTEPNVVSDSRVVAQVSSVDNRKVVRSQNPVSEDLSVNNRRAEEVRRAPERLYSGHDSGDQEAKRYVTQRPVSILTPMRIEERGSLDQQGISKVDLNRFREHVGKEQDTQYYHGMKEDEKMIVKRRKELF